MYAVVDIETTGGNSQTGKITEICAVLYNGFKVEDIYSRLINPGVPIPTFITKLTGISDEMVSEAPRFEEIAAELHAILANRIFVAHNASFDYDFLRSEFRRCGLEFRQKKLCTVQLSRRVFKDVTSYSLGRLCEELNIQIDSHHRAESDAVATAKVFERILRFHESGGIFSDHRQEKALKRLTHTAITETDIEAIPDEPGVYKLKDRGGNTLFLKRTSQLREGIVDKLGGEANASLEKLCQDIEGIDFERTGNIFLAALLEANEILHNKPPYNQHRVSAKLQCALVGTVSSSGQVKIKADRLNVLWKPAVVPLSCHSHFAEADKRLQKWVKVLYDNGHLSKKPVTHPKSGKFVQIETTFEGLANIEEFEHTAMPGMYWIVEDGRNLEEQCLILIHGGMPVGYLFTAASASPPSEISDLETMWKPHPLMRALVTDYIAKHPRMKKIKCSFPLVA